MNICHFLSAYFYGKCSIEDYIHVELDLHAETSKLGTNFLFIYTHEQISLDMTLNQDIRIFLQSTLLLHMMTLDLKLPHHHNIESIGA